MLIVDRLYKRKIRKEIRKFKLETIVELLEENEGPKIIKHSQERNYKSENQRSMLLTRREDSTNEIERYSLNFMHIK